MDEEVSDRNIGEMLDSCISTFGSWRDGNPCGREGQHEWRTSGERTWKQHPSPST